MSNAVSALNGAVWQDGAMSVSEAGLQGMITLRADLGAGTLKKAVQAGAGSAVPALRQIVHTPTGAAAWMSPDELLILCPYAKVGARVQAMTKALGETHALVADVSDARAMFTISGPMAREAVAKLAPIDLSPDGLATGEIRRTRLAQVPAAIWVDESGDVCVICFRSVAEYASKILQFAANPNSAVQYY